MGTVLRMALADVEALRGEFDTNLRHGRALLRAETDAEVLSMCCLVVALDSDDRTLSLDAQIVMASGGQVGVELRPFDDSVLETLRAFVDAVATPAEPAARSASSIPPDVQTESRQQQLRKLSMPQQQRLARKGELSDRVALERMYGKSVWEALLNNPKMTVPEVAKIARKGTVPKPLLTLIVDNPSWARQAPVRRALLANPRVGRDEVGKLLAMTPKHELKLIHRGTSYPSHIRDAAKKLLG